MGKNVEGCQTNDIIFYRKLFNTNPKVKWIYRDGIDKILKQSLSQFYVSNPKNNEVAGFFNIESDGRSVINKLNTNYTCFCILVNDVNSVISKTTPYPIIDFNDKTEKEQQTETHRLMRFIEAYQGRIFNQNSKTFKKLLSSLVKTDKRGNTTEISAAKILRKYLGQDYTVNVIGGLGNVKDMVHGVDLEISDGNNTMTAQVKPFIEFESDGDYITMIGTSNVKKYSTDLLIFQKNNEVLVFKNSPEIVNGNYKFKLNDLVHHIE